MATDTRRIVFDFVGRDNVSRTTRQVGSEIEGLQGKVGKLGGAMGGALKTGAVAGAAGLAAMGGAAIVFGVKTAASMEQAQVAFTTMLGSADKAKQFLDELQKFAAATPFELPQLTRASQRLLAFGFSAKEVIPTLTAIGDAVAGLGGGAEQIDQVTTAIGQMMAKGKIQSDELLQLTESGIPALKILANGFHKSSGEMQEMVTKGLVPANKAIPLLLKGIENGTDGAAGKTQKFAGMMKAQSKTLSGMWSTLKDNVSQALGNMITPFMPALKTGLNGLVGLTGKLSGGMQHLAKDAQRAGKEFRAGFSYGAKTGDTIESTNRLRELASKLGVAWRNLARIWKTDVLPPLKDLAKWFQEKIMPPLEKFQRQTLPEVAKQFKKIGDEIAKHKGTWKEFIADAKDLTAWVAKNLGPSLGWLGKVVLKGLGLWIRLSIKSFALMAEHFSKFWKSAKTTGENAIKLWKRISDGAGKMKDLAVRAFQTMARVFLDMATNLVRGAAKAFGWVPGVGSKLRAAAKEMADFRDRVNRSIAAIKDKKLVKVTVDAKGHWTVPGGGSPKTTAGLAKGGPVPALWSGASRQYDSQPALLRVDEHVWTPEEVDAAGGHGQILKLRQMAKQGLLKGYATGGPVGVDFKALTPSAGALKSSVWSPINVGYQAMIAKVAAALAKLIKTFGGAGGVVAAARRMIGYPYSWGGGGRGGPSYGIGRGAGTFGFDCSGLAECAWWKGAHVGIGGVTNSQWANSRPIGGPRPGALAFPSGPSVHVMLGSDRPGYVIQAPYTGSHVQEVRRSSGNWRWPTGAKYATGGPVARLGRDFVMGFGGPGDRQAAHLGGIAGSRAGGGPVSAGLPYLVGERGPEVIVPRGGGQVHSAGSRVVVQNIHLEVKVPTSYHKGAVGKELAECLRDYKNGGGKLP